MQIGISSENYYYKVLSGLLERHFQGSGISCSLGVYTSYNLLSESAIKFIETRSPDIIFLFLRQFPLMPLNKILIKFNRGKEEIHQNRITRYEWEFHPSLFNRRKMDWAPRLTDYTLNDAVLEPRREKFGMRDINLLSGLAAGLNDWAIKYILNEIKQVNDMCLAQNKKLILLSLPKNPESLIGNYVCKLTNAKLKPLLSQIPIIDISFIGEEYFEYDGIHYNVSGHKILAETMFNYLSNSNEISRFLK